MDKEFYLGMMLGILGGAIVSANSFKVRKAIKEGQEQVVSAINNLEKKEKTPEKTSEE